MDGIFGSLLRIGEFIIAFGLLVFLHELGHYLMAKVFKIEVEEFGFGFPPRLVKLFQFRETVFSLNWIPFGAFVRPKGENDPAVPGGLASASPLARLSVLFGGPVMNLITGVLLFTLVFSSIGAPDLETVLIMNVAEGSPAQAAGMQVDDQILAVNGTQVNSTNTLRQIVNENLEKEVTLTLKRGDQTLEVAAVPRSNPPEGQGALGIEMGNPVRQISALEAIPYSTGMMIDQGRQLISLPVMLIRGQVSPEEGRLVGPKGIYDIYQQARSMDEEEPAPTSGEPLLGINTLYFLATISIALGFTNLLPIPALDGGRILFVLPEIFLRRRVPAKYENMIHVVGFVMLLALMFYVTAQDIINPVVIP